MGLRIHERSAACPPWNYGGAFAFVLGLFAISVSAHAQQATSSGFDVRETERRFEVQDSTQGPNGRRGVNVPGVSQGETQADPTPIVVLRNVSLTGAHAIPPARLADAWQPFIGRKVSQADLVRIATDIGEAYRRAGFHLSRAIVPPQDIAGGTVRFQVIEGAICELELKGDGAGRFGVRALLDPVLAERPSRLTTLERQLMLVNGRPGVSMGHYNEFYSNEFQVNGTIAEDFIVWIAGYYLQWLAWRVRTFGGDAALAPRADAVQRWLVA